ncbi:uncharacterized protein LOC115757293 [Rhodamnia argentea]|uniref:Uncharacterized protein LOC115757293 n=1 Tax=Rhodamnia argentea TaxID=178133 RepID=A0A8B8R1I4_9MYRT|nr:uncharacterized protein LOC115757293 [Rhodamnia argentea]
MANSRIARFVMEAAPPQFVSVMRHRTSQMLDTISEEERDVGPSGPRRSPPKSLASACMPSSSLTARASGTASFGTATANSGNFFRGVDRSLSMFES